MAQIEKPQGAFKKLVDLFFVDFIPGEESVEVEVGNPEKRWDRATGRFRRAFPP
jgi:hypothetical protein